MLDYDALETLEGLTKMAVCMTKALLKLMLFKTLSHKQLHLKHSPILTTRKTKQKKNNLISNRRGTMEPCWALFPAVLFWTAEESPKKWDLSAGESQVLKSPAV